MFTSAAAAASSFCLALVTVGAEVDQALSPEADGPNTAQEATE